MSDMKPCPFCGGGITSIEGKGQIWRGVNGYSAPQWYQLNHFGKLSETDDFPRCNVEFRCRTEAEAIAAWNRRSIDPAAIREAALREAAALVASCTWSEYWVCDGEYMEPLHLSDRILSLIDKGAEQWRGQ